MRIHLTQPTLKAFDTAHSMEAIRRSMDAVEGGFDAEDILVLPEHALFVHERAQYEEVLGMLTREAGCHVLGGSFHEFDGEVKRNSGALFAPDGRVMGWYDKLRPYADERTRVDPGTRLGEFDVNGRRVMVLVCADFWFSDLFLQAETLPDLVLVPALSVTRKPEPDYSRRLWRHLAISRAYEFGLFVGISDWAHDSELPKLRTSGVGGFADTTQVDPDGFYMPIGSESVRSITPDFAALDRFRHDREARGFYWKK
ncbi:carbon-nitrogen hydrolase family protein [bacterium]|nr:carbon-nitrogen hydrolase family protein [bacterium]